MSDPAPIPTARSTTDWYLVLIVAFLTALAGGAAFWISQWGTTDPAWFEALAAGGFGSLLTMLVSKQPVAPPPPASTSEQQRDKTTGRYL
jgi:hypothetical protein